MPHKEDQGSLHADVQFVELGREDLASEWWLRCLVELTGAMRQCNGPPNCRNCERVGSLCEPHARVRRVE